MPKKTVCLLAQIMIQRGINQEQLSLNTGVSRKTIRNLQKNVAILWPIEQIDVLCNYLDLELWDLFQRVEVDK